MNLRRLESRVDRRLDHREVAVAAQDVEEVAQIAEHVGILTAKLEDRLLS
jgi:hypothetical protein